MTDGTSYHAVLWNEPLIYQLGRTGRRGLTVPKAESKIRSNVGDVLARIPSQIRRKKPPKLPEISEPEVIRHYIHLSQETYGVDSGINLGVGTCTMKYSPKVNELLVRSSKLTDAHPLQDEGTVQGILEIMFRLGKFLCEISGMDEFSLQPRAGAHAVLTNARIIKAYHKSRGELEQRNEIITTVLSHPCNGAAPAVAGFKVITLYPNKETGVPDVEALKAVVSQHTAGLMFTYPYDTGVFDPNIGTFFKIIHEAGGLVAIDQANANGVLGKLRVGDVGADLCQFNLHKTFSTPHASSGPGSAPIGVKKQLVKFLPVPTVEFDEKKYSLNYDHPQSIGKVASFYGVIPNVVRAYAWILSMGAKGLQETSEVAIINNNYLIKKMLKIRGVTLPWVKSHPKRLQEARFSLEKMKQDTGIGIDELNCRIVDYGIQKCFTSHEPWIIPEPFTPEPTESTPKEDIDKFVEVFKRISHEAYSNPEILKKAPHNCSISKIDSTPSRDPKKWALTWRAYLKKHQ
jgi:glycine cleavage system P protein (glycine dehydrogenase) subunit 2